MRADRVQVIVHVRLERLRELLLVCKDLLLADVHGLRQVVLREGRDQPQPVKRLLALVEALRGEQETRLVVACVLRHGNVPVAVATNTGISTPLAILVHLQSARAVVDNPAADRQAHVAVLLGVLGLRGARRRGRGPGGEGLRDAVEGIPVLPLLAIVPVDRANGQERPLRRHGIPAPVVRYEVLESGIHQLAVLPEGGNLELHDTLNEVPRRVSLLMKLVRKKKGQCLFVIISKARRPRAKPSAVVVVQLQRPVNRDILGVSALLPLRGPNAITHAEQDRRPRTLPSGTTSTAHATKQHTGHLPRVRNPKLHSTEEEPGVARRDRLHHQSIAELGQTPAPPLQDHRLASLQRLVQTHVEGHVAGPPVVATPAAEVPSEGVEVFVEAHVEKVIDHLDGNPAVLLANTKKKPTQPKVP
mmetsp:Transcript_30921/g.103011  ORF Transcript_30921/g.103011 Transcript_30921/m.103011 type:complete len:417 (-) Transcript_30921:9-1259(-)